MQNIFFIIVEDSYISIKYAKNFEWLLGGYNPAIQQAQGQPQGPPGPHGGYGYYPGGGPPPNMPLTGQE